MVQFHIALFAGAVVRQPFFLCTGRAQFAGGLPGVAVAVFGGHGLVPVDAVYFVNHFFGVEVAYYYFAVYTAVKIKSNVRVIGGFFNKVSRAAYIFVGRNNNLNFAVFFGRIFRQGLNESNQYGHPGFVVGREHGGPVRSNDGFANHIF